MARTILAEHRPQPICDGTRRKIAKIVGRIEMHAGASRDALVISADPRFIGLDPETSA